MKTNSMQAPSTLIPEYIGSSFDAVLEVASNIEAVKVVAKNVDTFGVPLASETKAGIAEIATQAEVNQKTNDSHIVTPKKLGAYAAPLVHNHATATSTESGFLSATDKQKLDGIASNANNYTHPTTDGSLHVPATGTTNNGKLLKAGATAGSLVWDTISKTDVGLSNVDNTSDVNKPISIATQTALDGKSATTHTHTATDVGAAPAVHTHVITDVAGLQTALEGKSATGHTHNYLPLTGGTLTGALVGTTFTGALTGNASTATLASKLTAARTISLTGDVTGSVSFDGSTDVTLATSYKSSGVTAGTYKSVTVDEKGHITTGSNPTTLAGYGITDAVLSSDVVTTAAASKILKLDANSKLPASITGNADGNAATATKLATARTINGVSFDGSADITINAVDSTSRIASSEKGIANGVATLGSDGKISSSQLPEYSASTVDSVAGKTGVVTLVKDDVGLSNVDNTSDLDKPISTAQQSVLNLKANLASPAFTGTPSAPTATVGTSTVQIATTAFVNAEIANDAAPASHVGATGTAHGVATTSVAGFMSAADKTKLDSMGSGGDYTHPTSGVTSGTYKSVTVNDQGHVTGGTNPTTLSGYGITDATGSSHIGSGGAAHGVVTTTVDGFMSAADKTKLNGVATGATKNSTDAYLLNRANHTGTQTTSTITGLDTTLSTINTSLTGKLDKAGGVISGPITEKIPTTIYTYTGDNITSITENYLGGVKTTSFQYTGDTITSMVEQYAGSTTTTTYVYDESGNLVSASSTYA